MLLSEEHRLIQETATRFALDEILANRDKFAENKPLLLETMKKLGQLGLLSLLVPETLGGVNAGFLAYAVAMEAVAYADASISTFMSVQNSVVMMPLVQFGTDSQKNQFLPSLISGESLGAFCLTEPNAGSDAAAIQSSARREADGYVINGNKQFITLGDSAGLAIVFANVDFSLGKKGITAFLVPRNTPGYQMIRIEHKMGQSASETAQLVFENCKIPLENRLGAEGEGLKIALSQLESGRIGIAAQALGIACRAFELTKQYAKERKTFGKKLIEHQAIQFKLAEMEMQICAARQLIWHAATLKDAKLPAMKECAMAKLFAAEVSEFVCREAIQIHGGYGYLEDYEVERLYRDQRVCALYEGTSEVQKMIISKMMT